MSKKVRFTQEQRQLLEDNAIVAATIVTNIAASVADDTPISKLPDSVMPTTKLYALALAYLGVIETLAEAGVKVTNISNKTLH